MNKLLGSFRIGLLLVAGLIPVFGTTGALGATIEWQAMQGRERIVITKAMTEGMTGNVTRVDANGIGIPFNQVPSGLTMKEPPKDASIIKGTAQFGQTLAILTQTPKFGFVVSRQTPTQIIIDFFPDELGARWKSDGTSALDLGTQSTAPAVSAQPQPQTPSQVSGQAGQVLGQPTGQSTGQPAGQSTGQASGQTPTQGREGKPSSPQPPVPTGSLASSTPSPTPPASPATAEISPGSASTPIGWKAQPVQTNAPLLTADGTKPAAAQEAPTSPIPVVALPTNTVPTTPLPEGVLLDTRQDTAERSAALPAPGLDVSLAAPDMPFAPRSGEVPQQGQAQQPPVSQTVQNTTPSSVTGGTNPSTASGNRVNPAGTTSAGVQPAMEASSVPAPAQPSAKASTQADGQTGPQPNMETSNSETAPLATEPNESLVVDGTPLLQGVGRRVGVGSYRGLFNPEGIEGIAPTETLSGAPQNGEASTAQPHLADQIVPEAGQTSDQGNSSQGADPQAPSGGQPSQQTAGAVRLVADEPETASQGQVAPEKQTATSETVTPATPEEQAGVTDALDAATSLEVDEDVIYVNEDGEEIIPPADPVKRLEEIRALIAEKKYAEANELVTALLGQTNLSKEQREDALHIRAEMLFFLHRENLQQYAGSIIEATDMAINANSRSPKNAVALLRLGYVNLQLDNIPEAEARFNMLRRMFPNDENVPLSYYYWGDYFYNKDDLERAIDQFQVVTQKYPGSKYAREASLGLARSFYRLGYYEQAFNIVEYIEQRWPRFYLNYPPFLNMMGDVAFRLNNFDFATRYYWLYANLDPNGEEVDVILTRIGDIYSLQQQPVAAKEVYGEVVSRFPDTDGGLIALMRLAEESINDDPSIATMFNAFDSKPVLRPVDVYEKIIKEYPQSKYVSLAQLKLAMWYLWNHDYTTTLDMADAFLRAKPQDELAPKMKEVALKTFAVLSAESVANGSFSRMRDIWERYPMLKEQEEILTPESRVALGVSYWKDGRPDDALIAVEPFFLGNKIPEYSEMALSLVLKIYLQYDQWPAIEEVGRRVSLWEISDDNQMQLDYALAYARENMNKPDEAAVLWEKLYDSKRLPDDQMVYATYFLARDAEKRQRNDEAYLLGVEALKRLRSEAEKNPEQEDTGKIKSQISSLMSLTEEGGRLGESLGYAEEYLQYLPENDPDKAAVLFRMGRINKKQGNEALWRERMTEIVRLYPDTVYGQTADAALKSTDLEKAASAYSPQR